ncbi:FAD binding domain-containing protein [Rhodococcus sp. 105337]|uniref:FAD binding domain-containing protein n=1 Tax=unclassified Rhodococcus (in: high G+C Gram-positive bacteria) TaxID=192944 RepID=UPI00146CAB5C|nr:FAD binding domain-containing protein [Rhodococcus sp. 105337]NME81074.1 dehydrogenase [Rhodococcus sp. 105337]
MRMQMAGAGLIAQNQSGMPPFVLHQPSDLATARQLVARHPESTLAAGCSDLFARIREGERIERLISLQQVDELRRISMNTDGVLKIGSTVSHHQGSSNPTVIQAIPNFATAWSSIATIRIRYTGTIGGNLMAGRTRYEMHLMLSALDARRVCDPTGRLLEVVEIDTSDLVWFGYERSMRPTATVALAVRRVAGGLAVRAVAGSEYRSGYVLHTLVDDLAMIDAFATGQLLAEQLPDECADYTGSAEYRRHLVSVLVRRLLENVTKRRNT